MTDCKYFTPEIRCYQDGRVERFFRKKRWTLVANTANHKDGYNYIGVDGKMVFRHRIIGFCFHGLNIDDPTEIMDHINRDRLDNSAGNLRVVTQQQNLFNTGARGYFWNKTKGKWQGQIYTDGRQIYLGLFIEEADARQAYLDAKAIHHVI
tara:strand:+ start:84 stop:536 length:453 start_codon:yes stop_codon:yes gene_type:complete